MSKWLSIVNDFAKNISGNVPSDIQKDFEKEIEERVYANAKTGIFLALVFWPLFGILDYILYSNLVITTLAIRFATCLVFGLLLLCDRTALFKNHSKIFALAIYQIGNISLSAIICVAGGETSVYYAGVCLIILAMIAGIPWNLLWAAANCLILWAEYFLSIVLFDKEIVRIDTFISNNFFIFATISVALTYVVVVSRITRNEFIARKMLAKEKQISEDLLLNILPKSIAVELKENGFVKPTYYTEATVMFIDFVGFTEMSKKLKVKELIELLGFYFTHYDRIIQKYNLEKLKTIGDCYMCAGGLPVNNISHPKDSILAALDIISMMSGMMKERPFCPIRIGIYTGELVAGVIGEKKFAYDIWGDTVNLAARLESNSQAGKINISKKTYEKIKDDFECEYRGEIFVKGGGNIDMYFVTKVKSNKEKQILETL
ncbi:MAG: adenylate/guanylate cyclase domain-containing protein [Candidatus Anammoxibacter sp.]